MPLSVLDLFSGIGGFSLGLERTGGFQTIAFCEIDPFCRTVIAKNFPRIPIYEDVTKLSKETLDRARIATPRVICGGFPCQDISTAGKGVGITGERSGLWFEYARLISELRPDYVIVENVTALLVRGIDRVLGSLAEIGYDAEWHCIPASCIGAPHGRDRIWIVAYPNKTRRVFSKEFATRLFEIERTGKTTLAWQSFRTDDRRTWAQKHGAILGNVDGLPGGVDKDRIESLGNSIVPQIAEIIGNAILAAER